MKYAQGFVDFLNNSHTRFHAVASVEEKLKEAGFVKLKENQPWHLENNRYYYVVRNQSSVIAFKIPEMINVRSINIIASHTDSPCLKIKPLPEITNEHYTKFGVEVYGGPIMSSWMDRPLSIAGRVTVKESGALVNKLVDWDENTTIIPNVAIHQNREVNNGYKWNAQTDMMPLMCDEGKKEYLYDMISKKLGCLKDDIMGHDLVLYNRTPATLWGENKQFISSARIDNLESVYTSLMGFLNSYSGSSLSILAAVDNEEIGSRTRQGMASSFLADVIERIFASFFYSSSDVKAVLANSFMISADNGHCVHPNHPELFDSANQVYMNKGVVIKTSATMSYTNDSVSVSVLKQLADRAGVPYQVFANRSDVRGGGTQAASAQINLPILTSDIGTAQTAMHSCYETAGAEDVDYMVGLMKEFYNSSFTIDDTKVVIEK